MGRIGLMVFALCASVALAEKPYGFTDGNDLLRGIRDVERALEGHELTTDRQQNAMYALGFFDGALGNALLWSKIDKACPFKVPESADGSRTAISVEQLIRVTEKYLTGHPELLNESPSLPVMLALKESFPR